MSIPAFRRCWLSSQGPGCPPGNVGPFIPSEAMHHIAPLTVTRVSVSKGLAACQGSSVDTKGRIRVIGTHLSILQRH